MVLRGSEWRPRLLIWSSMMTWRWRRWCSLRAQERRTGGSRGTSGGTEGRASGNTRWTGWVHCPAAALDQQGMQQGVQQGVRQGVRRGLEQVMSGMPSMGSWRKVTRWSRRGMPQTSGARGQQGSRGDAAGDTNSERREGRGGDGEVWEECVEREGRLVWVREQWAGRERSKTRIAYGDFSCDVRRQGGKERWVGSSGMQW